MEDMVIVATPRCVMCGKYGSVSMDRIEYERWKGGELLQYAAKSLSADEREQVLTGTHPLCWYQLIGDEHD